VILRPASARLALTVALLTLIVACSLDLRRPPAAQWSARTAVGVVHLYQRTLSRVLGGAGLRCRFTPTCSRYAEAVLVKHGAAHGAWLTLRRIARCGPWTPMGTRDEP
jgi:uncharacterized protein